MEKDNLALLNNLLVVAAADHKLKPIEGAYILNVMSELGEDVGAVAKKLDELWNDWTSPKLIVPDSFESKIQSLKLMAGLIWIDGKITDSEKKKFKKIAGEFGLDDDSAEAILITLIREYESNENINSFKMGLEKMAKELEKGGIKTQWIF